jgi:hypothetical protein
MVLLLWGALSDERTGLSFVCAAGPCQRSLSRVRIPWDSRPYFTLSDLRVPFSSPPTILDPSSTRGYFSLEFTNELPFITAREPNRDHRLQRFHYYSSWNALSRKRAWTVACQTDISVSGSNITAFRRCLPSPCLANCFFGVLSRNHVLVSRCLAMDFSGFQASCHNIYKRETHCVFKSLCVFFLQQIQNRVRAFHLISYSCHIPGIWVALTFPNFRAN